MSALGADMPHRAEERSALGGGHATQGDRRLSKEHVRLGGGHATPIVVVERMPNAGRTRRFNRRRR